MTSAGTAFTFISRRFTAAFVILGIVSLSLLSAGDEYYIAPSGTELERHSYPATEDIPEIAKQGPSAHSFSLHQRTKVKAKVLYRKFVSLFSASAYLYNPSHGLHHFSQVLDALKPEYYGFLFRYTPF